MPDNHVWNKLSGQKSISPQLRTHVRFAHLKLYDIVHWLTGDTATYSQPLIRLHGQPDAFTYYSRFWHRHQPRLATIFPVWLLPRCIPSVASVSAYDNTASDDLRSRISERPPQEEPVSVPSRQARRLPRPLHHLWPRSAPLQEAHRPQRRHLPRVQQALRPQGQHGTTSPHAQGRARYRKGGIRSRHEEGQRQITASPRRPFFHPLLSTRLFPSALAAHSRVMQRTLTSCSQPTSRIGSLILRSADTGTIAAILRRHPTITLAWTSSQRPLATHDVSRDLVLCNWSLALSQHCALGIQKMQSSRRMHACHHGYD